MSKNNKKSISGFTIAIIGIVLFIIVSLLFLVVFRIELKKNQLEEEKQQLTEVYEELDYDNKKKKNDLEQELDEEKIRQLAKDELDRVEPNSEYYYGD